MALLQQNIPAHAEIFAAFLFLSFTCRKQTYFLVGDRGWVDGPFVSSDKRWVKKKKKKEASCSLENCCTSSTPEELSLSGNLPWGEVNHTAMVSAQGRLSVFPLPAASGHLGMSVLYSQKMCAGTHGSSAACQAPEHAHQWNAEMGKRRMWRK